MRPPSRRGADRPRSHIGAGAGGAEPPTGDRSSEPPRDEVGRRDGEADGILCRLAVVSACRDPVGEAVGVASGDVVGVEDGYLFARPDEIRVLLCCAASGLPDTSLLTTRDVLPVAERVGFEPTIPGLAGYSISSRAPSSTRPPLRAQYICSYLPLSMRRMVSDVNRTEWGSRTRRMRAEANVRVNSRFATIQVQRRALTSNEASRSQDLIGHPVAVADAAPALDVLCGLDLNIRSARRQRC